VSSFSLAGHVIPRPQGVTVAAALTSAPGTRLPNPQLSVGSTEFRAARVLYYVGMTFVAAGALRPFGGLDVSDWFFLASLVVVAGTVAFKRVALDFSLPGVFLFGFAVFSIGAVFSLPVALHPVDSAGAFARFTFTVFVWFALGSIVLRDRSHVEIAIGAWVLSVGISGLAAIAQVRWGALLFASFTTVPLDPLGVGYAGREIGLSGHPNDLGGAAAIVVAPAILFAATSIWTGAQRYAFIGLLGLVLACIVLSGSVTAFGAALAGAAIWLATGRVAPKRLIAIAATLALTSLALLVVNQQGASSVLSPIDRVSSTLGLETTTLATGLERLNLDAIAWNLIVHSPLYGVGLDGNSVAQAMGGVGVHNMFLFVWVGAGVFAFLGLVLMVISLASNYVAEYRASNSAAEQTLVLALGTSFVSFLIVASAQPIVFVRYAWVPAALLFPLRVARLRADKAARVQNGRMPPRGTQQTAVRPLPSEPIR
jgi:O-antigen ligase